MKKILIAGAATLLAATAYVPAAWAQAAGSDNTKTAPGDAAKPPPAPGNVPPAGQTMQKDASIADTPSTTSTGPEKGANSFTEGQAQGKISDAGYTAVTGLKKDGDGIWRGTAMKDGQQVSVWLDYAGHVGKS